jgi:hypothetical protein
MGSRTGIFTYNISPINASQLVDLRAMRINIANVRFGIYSDACRRSRQARAGVLKTQRRRGSWGGSIPTSSVRSLPIPRPCIFWSSEPPSFPSVADPPLPPGRRGMQSLAATAPSSVASDSIAPVTGQQRSVRNRIVFIWIC